MSIPISLLRPIFTFFIVISISLGLQAQSWQWARSAGGFAQGNEDEFTATAVDDSGNVYVAGKFKDLGWFDSLRLNAEGTNFDAFVAKYSCQGDLRWVRRIEGAGYSWVDELILDHQGRPVVSGGFGANGPGDSTRIADTTFQKPSMPFVLQLNSDGSRGWLHVNEYEKEGSMRWSHGQNQMIEISDGSFLILAGGGGYYTATDSLIPGVFLMSISNRGKMNWVKNISSSGIPISLNRFSDGSLGFAFGVSPLDSVEVFNKMYKDPHKRGRSFFGRMDNQGNKIEVKATETGPYLSHRLSVNSLHEFKDGYIAFGTTGKFGTYDGDTLFEEDSKSLTSLSEGVIIKLDKNLNKEWHERTSSRYSVDFWDMRINSSDIAYVTGHVAGPVYFGSNTITTGSRSDDFLFSFDLGQRQWNSYEMLLTTGDDNDRIHDLEIDAKDNVILAGKYEGWMYFDPQGPNIDTLFYRGGNSNAIVMKYGSTDCPVPPPISTPDYGVVHLMEEGFSMYPNPSNSLVHLQFDKPIEEGAIRIFNLSAQLVEEVSIASTQEHQLDVSDYISGMYLVEVNDGKQRWVQRLLVE